MSSLKPCYESELLAETEALSRRFDYCLCALLAASAVLWTYAYLQFDREPSGPTQGLKIAIISLNNSTPQETARINIAAPTLAAEPQVTAAIIETQKKVVDKTVSSQTDAIAAEIRAALESQINASHGNNAANEHQPQMMSKEFRQLRDAARQRKRGKPNLSGRPFTTQMEHIDSQGNLSYRADNGCIFERREVNGAGTWWYSRGCKTTSEITLKYQSDHKKTPSFETSLIQE